MLIVSMGVSADGYINDRDGGFQWTAPIDDLFEFHLEQVGLLGGYLLGRRLYENMSVWETDPYFRSTEANAAFADVWAALPKVVFSRTLERVDGNARLASGSVADEIAAAVSATDKDVSIGGADLVGQAVGLDLIDEFRLFRYPIITGGGTPLLPSLPRPLPLDLIETRTFGSQVAYERYRRVR
ncbi:dihydrofolate reductase family protein [Amnibacterium flavum]|uniref:Deaminase n=1 Tax=Amnibacterium flavum TaxID=2173173 RepID=A0A2V1HQ34_9MICO|nr:dihydrofolate reductase family protein [Amnibacterium flavum]PVZ94635.1 deaminase [Amnibacterium flavum]